MFRQASPKCLTNLLQDDGVAPAGGQQHTRIEQAWRRWVGGRGRTRDPVNRRPQVGGLDRLGQEIVHACREAPLAVFFPRARRQGDDGQMAPHGPLTIANRLDNLEAV